MKKLGFVLLLVLFSKFSFSTNITVVGIGRLGICLALCFEKAGYNVLGVDVSPEYVEKVNSKLLKTNEPFVEEWLQKSKNLRATTSLEEGLAFSDLCFVTLSTTLGTEAYNFEPLNNLLSHINSLKVSNKNIVISSTVYPGYITYIAKNYLKDCPNTFISYNPPFIAQGEIIKGLTQPDMVLIGQHSPSIGALLEDIYSKVCSQTTQFVRVSVESAEITKLAVNCFITMKIAYANLVGEIADETINANKFDILKAAGKDSRIGSKYLLPGYGFGGPCFPRDNRGLGQYATSKGVNPLMFESTDKSNALHAHYMAAKLLSQGKDEYVFEDISYKENSAVKIIDESQKLVVAKIIALAGKKVIIRDIAEAIALVKDKFGSIFSYEIIT